MTSAIPASDRHWSAYSAGNDWGFSSIATTQPEVHPTVVWAKSQAMAEGARLASKQLWGR